MEHLQKWLGYFSPDLVCLQETKVVDEDFPREPLEELGYHCTVAGQKSYNGVAILSREPVSDVTVGLAHLGDDHVLNSQKRLIAATVGDLRIISAYFPNGEALDSDKFKFKLQFLQELRTYFNHFHKADEKIILCGDFNICPDSRDLYNPEERGDNIFASPQEREALEHLRAFGFTDLFRHYHDEAERYSWWDYRGGMFWKGLGMRLDHIWATGPVVASATGCDIDERPRRWKKPSDHTVCWAELKG